MEGLAKSARVRDVAQKSGTDDLLNLESMDRKTRRPMSGLENHMSDQIIESATVSDSRLHGNNVFRTSFSDATRCFYHSV